MSSQCCDDSTYRQKTNQLDGEQDSVTVRRKNSL